MKLTLNRDYARRHLGVALLMVGLSAWFAYDGAVKYPALDDVTFAREILHGKDPSAATFSDARKTATGRQFQFAGLALLAALIVGGNLLRSKRMTLEWDADARTMTGSLTGGRTLSFDDIASLDDAKWDKKGIMTLITTDGYRISLDTWHHTGARELALLIQEDVRRRQPAE